jgi:hypothetical protein
MRDGELRKIFKKNLPMVHWQAVELGAIGSGCPDSNFCHEGIEGWIEYKLLRKDRIEMDPEQIGWITNRMRHGGRVKIAVRSMGIVEALILFDGSAAEMFDGKNINENFNLIEAHYLGPPKSWDWMNILQVIKMGRVDA